MSDLSVIKDKLREASLAVLPITVLVSVLCLFLIPMDSGLMLAFVLGSLLLISGMALFTLGSDMSMTEIGNHIGSRMTRSRNLTLILSLSLVLGAAITIAEPDLQVLAANVPAVDTMTLIIVVSLGVAISLMLAMIRILFAIPIVWMLIVLYALVFGLAAFTDKGFLSIAFDSGGVTTGPMTVPFIISLGMGVSAIRSDENARSDGFGLVALCSVGPIIAVMILGFIYPDTGTADVSMTAVKLSDTLLIGRSYISAFPEYMAEVARALAPIFAFFMVFQVVSLRLRKKSFLGILMGIAYTYIGLVLFLTGVNVGFSPLGFGLGESIAKTPFRTALVPLAMLMGWFIINAEPAVHVLNKQVEELSAGAISARAMGTSLSIAVAAANGLAMIRVLTGAPIMWFLIPGYAISLILAFFVPPTFTAIAFDSGGVASGPMTATFMLPFVMGACQAAGGNVMTDAFGLVAMVAMTPLITVQVMGAISTVRSAKLTPSQEFTTMADDAVIELWEAA